MKLTDRHIWSVMPPILGIDFDGPLNATRRVGVFELDEEARHYIPLLYKLGCILTLWTSSWGERQREVEDFITAEGLRDYFISTDGVVPGLWFKYGRKIFANFYVDDNVIGGFPGWDRVYSYIAAFVKEFEEAAYNTSVTATTKLTESLIVEHYPIGWPETQRLRLLGGFRNETESVDIVASNRDDAGGLYSEGAILSHRASDNPAINDQRVPEEAFKLEYYIRRQRARIYTRDFSRAGNDSE